MANFHGQKGDRHVNVYLWDASTRESVQFVIAKKKKKMKLDFHAFFLLLTMNFVIALSKKSADPSYRLVDPQLL